MSIYRSRAILRWCVVKTRMKGRATRLEGRQASRAVRNIVQLRPFVSGEPVVESHFELARLTPREPNVLQHRFQLSNWNSRLVLVESKLIVDQLNSSQNLKDGVHDRTGPRQDQRPPWPQDPVRLGQYIFRPRQMLKHGKHRHMIELSAFEWQPSGYVRANQGDLVLLCIFGIVVEPDARCDSCLDVLQKRRSRATAEVAYAGLKSNVRGRGSKTAPGNETIERGIGHLSIQPFPRRHSSARHRE